MIVVLLSLVMSVSPAETRDRVRAGFDKFPIAECPSISKRYTDLTDKLAQIKKSIRETTNCKDEQLSFDGFAKLVNEDRQEFLKLTAKGTVSLLSEEENKKIAQYIENVTKMGGQITDLILGSHCFKDDKKNTITVDVVASLITEATGALKNIKGPVGAAVSLTGRMTSTLITSLDKVVRSRTAYDFADSDQRKNFIQTMCSYAGFRHEINEISRVDATMAELTRLANAYQTQLNDIYKDCAECKEMAVQYFKDYHKDETYVRDNSEIQKKFATQIGQANDRFVEPIGFQTVVAMRSLVWTQDQMWRVEKNLNDLGDVERDRVVQMQDVLEEFLFEKWHPKLIEYYVELINSRMYLLRRNLARAASDLGQISSLAKFRIFPDSYLPTAPELVQILWTDGAIGFRQSGFRTHADLTIFLNGARAEFDRQIGEIVSAVVLTERNCEFVRAGNLRYESRSQKICASEALQNAYDFLWAIYQSTHRHSTTVSSIFAVPSTTLYTWADERCVWLPVRDLVWVATASQKATLLMHELRTKYPGFPLKEPKTAN